MKISRSMLLWGGIFLAIVMFLGSYSVKEGFFVKPGVFVKSGDACSKNKVNKTSASGTLRCEYNSKEKKYVWKEIKEKPQRNK